MQGGFLLDGLEVGFDFVDGAAGPGEFRGLFGAAAGDAEEVEDLHQRRVVASFLGDVADFAAVHEGLAGADEQAVALGLFEDIQGFLLAFLRAYRVDDMDSADAPMLHHFGFDHIEVDAFGAGEFPTLAEQHRSLGQLTIVGDRLGDVFEADLVDADRVEEAGGFAGGGDTAGHGLADVGEAHQGAAHEDALFAGKAYLAVLLGGEEACRAEFAVDQFGPFAVIVEGDLSGGHDDDVVVSNLEFVGFRIEVADAQVAVRLAHDLLDAAAHQSDPMLFLGVGPILLEPFAKGTHIHVKDGRFDIVATFFLGQHRLLEREHAAHRGAVVTVLPFVA